MNIGSLGGRMRPAEMNEAQEKHGGSAVRLSIAQTVLITATIVPATVIATIQRPCEVEWIRQFGTDWRDESWGVSTDGFGNVYVSGSADGVLDGPSEGDGRSFVRKYTSTGDLVWTRRPGPNAFDLATGIESDDCGNVYVSGYTQGAFGSSNVGYSDAYICKYDSAGNLSWARQLGSSYSDFAMD
jgi:hypothetical protein